MPFRHLATPLILAGLLIGCVASEHPDASSTSESRNPGPETTGTAAATTPDAPSVTPTISLTPRAGTTPAQPTAAHRLEAEGELQQALDAYLSRDLGVPPEARRREGELIIPLPVLLPGAKPRAYRLFYRLYEESQGDCR